MRMRSGTRPLGTSGRLAVAALVALGGATAVSAQPPMPFGPTGTTPSPAAPVISGEMPSASKVFPEGGFPSYPRASEGGVPGPSTAPVLRSKFPLLQPAGSDYAPAGYAPGGPQEGPAAEYRPLTAPLPAYYYRPGYYSEPGSDLRSVSEYAPPGYEARDTDEGQAPGVPEFTPITPPAPITPEERQKFVTRGIFPGSFLVPGTNTSFRLRGFVRLTGLYDFDPIGSRDDFVTNTIPVPARSGQNYNMAARYSRFALETWTPTELFEWNVHTFIEGDFFNGPAQAVGGGSNPFRLRHAFVDYGWFRVGQQNTVFMDGNAFPNTVDFAGPRGLVNQRRPGARVTLPLCDNLFWATGIEQPFSDITTNQRGIGVQDVPDFATHVRYEGDYGHFQLSGLLRAIGYRPVLGTMTRRVGGGLSASAVIHPWALLNGSNPVHKDNPNGLERSRILMQYTFGWGIGRYIQDTAGLGLDGQVDPTTGVFDTIFATGWSVSYEHWFTEQWLTNVTYSPDYVASVPNQPGSTYSGAKYLAASVWYIPIRNLSIGLEYLWGERENLNGQRGRADRINALMQYNF